MGQSLKEEADAAPDEEVDVPADVPDVAPLGIPLLDPLEALLRAETAPDVVKVAALRAERAGALAVASRVCKSRPGDRSCAPGWSSDQAATTVSSSRRRVGTAAAGRRRAAPLPATGARRGSRRSGRSPVDASRRERGHARQQTPAARKVRGRGGTHAGRVAHATLAPDALVEEALELAHAEPARLLDGPAVRLAAAEDVVKVAHGHVGLLGAQRRLLTPAVVVRALLRVRQRLVGLLQLREVERRLLQARRVLV